MTTTPRSSFEMHTIPRPGNVTVQRISVEARQEADVFIPSNTPPSTEVIRPTRRQTIQSSNQIGWVGFCLRWVPVFALGITIMGGVFSYMNHRALDAQKTLKLVRGLQPALVTAHAQILAGLHSLQALLGINSTQTDTVPPIPPAPGGN